MTMSIFNQILSAIDNPEKEASTNQLGSILDTVQQLSRNYQAHPDAVQSAMSIVGNYTKSALQQQRSQGVTICIPLSKERSLKLPTQDKN